MSAKKSAHKIISANYSPLSGNKIPLYRKANGQAEFRPLILVSSGGGGHWVAGKAIKANVEKLTTKIKPKILELTKQEANSKVEHAAIGEIITDFPIYGKPPKQQSSGAIKIGQKLTHEYLFSPAVTAFLQLLNLPVLPKESELTAKISQIYEQRSDNDDCKDVLLWYFSEGAASAAIFNLLQQKDQIEEIKRLLDLQPISDFQNRKKVEEKTLADLIYQAEKDKPYTEIFCTQAMALPAICNAVIKYNAWLDKKAKENNRYASYPKLTIHQYLTDLPTEGAIHFFKPLTNLNAEQQSIMKVYGVGMEARVIDHFFGEKTNFAGLHSIPVTDNPMIRPEFTDPQYDNSKKFHETITLKLKDKGGNSEFEVPIEANEPIATIMLGSQASQDTVSYLRTILANGYKKVFVAGGYNNELSKGIDEVLKEFPDLADRVIRLDNQDGKHLTQLLTRSQLVCLRGGGLTMMETLAIPHNPLQTILIHHADKPGITPHEKKLSSGISWENKNVNKVIRELGDQITIKKTSPILANTHIPAARLQLVLEEIIESNKDIQNNSNTVKEIETIKYKLKKVEDPVLLHNLVRFLETKELSNNAKKILPLMKSYFSLTNSEAQANWTICLEKYLVDGQDRHFNFLQHPNTHNNELKALADAEIINMLKQLVANINYKTYKKQADIISERLFYFILNDHPQEAQALVKNVIINEKNNSNADQIAFLKLLPILERRFSKTGSKLVIEAQRDKDSVKNLAKNYLTQTGFINIVTELKDNLASYEELLRKKLEYSSKTRAHFFNLLNSNSVMREKLNLVSELKDRLNAGEFLAVIEAILVGIERNAQAVKGSISSRGELGTILKKFNLVMQKYYPEEHKEIQTQLQRCKTSNIS